MGKRGFFRGLIAVLASVVLTGCSAAFLSTSSSPTTHPIATKKHHAKPRHPHVTATARSSATASAKATASTSATPGEASLAPTTTAGCPAPAAEPVTSAPGAGRTIALTFDDGSSTWTPKILAVLERFHIHATFFDTGLHDHEFPQYAKQVLAAGNVVGNHTYNHLMNWGYRKYFTEAEQRAEVVNASAVLAPLIGHQPCLMRPPGGAYDAGSLALVRSLGMSMVLWSTDSKDWQQPPFLSMTAQQTILHNAEQGIRYAHPILLMHAGKASHEPPCPLRGCAEGEVSDFRGNTVAILPKIIQFYLDHGYTFVTV